MAKTKIRIIPLKDYRVQLVLEVNDITKEDVKEVADSYLFELKKTSKSGNSLSFSIVFENKYFYRNAAKGGNPSIILTSANKKLSLKITNIFKESEIRRLGSLYAMEVQAIGENPFTIKFEVGYSYFREKILVKREADYKEKRYTELNEVDDDIYLMPKLKRYDAKGIYVASENGSRCCNNCIYMSDEFKCGRHQQRVHKQNVCSSYQRPKFVSGGLVSPK